MLGTAIDSVGLDSWRPNNHIFGPQDYWRGSVDYAPWKLGDADDTSRAVVKTQKEHYNLDALQMEAEQIGAVAPDDPNRKIARARVAGTNVSGEIELELGVSANQSGAVGGGDGCGVSRRYSSGKGTKPGEVETALHGVLDALRKVRAERMRVTSRHITRAPSDIGG